MSDLCYLLFLFVWDVVLSGADGGVAEGRGGVGEAAISCVLNVISCSCLSCRCVISPVAAAWSVLCVASYRKY
jgi:hypothetical protein